MKKSFRIRVAVCLFAIMMLGASSSVMAVTMNKSITFPKNAAEVTVCAASSFYNDSVQIQASTVTSGKVTPKYPLVFVLRKSNGSTNGNYGYMKEVPGVVTLTPAERVSWRLMGYSASGKAVTIDLHIAY